LAKPSTLRVMAPMSRAVMVRAQSAQWDWATCL